MPNDVNVEFKGVAFQGFTNTIKLEVVSGLPADAVATFSQATMPADGTNTLNLDFTAEQNTGLHNIVVQATAEGADTLQQIISVRVQGTSLVDFQLVSPASGAVGISKFPDFSWSPSVNSTGYTLEVATSPAFGNTTFLTREVGLDTTATGIANLDNSTLYYWRVIAENPCLGPAPSTISTFGSVALSCKSFEAVDIPVTISSAGTPTVMSEIEIFESGTVSDININFVRGNHSSVGDLRGSIVSPSGTKVVLWEGECANIANFNTGFDDDSFIPNGCPNKAGQKIQSKELLSAFIGEELQGNWAFLVEDFLSGNGGRINEYGLEICSNSVLNSPFIVNNNVLEVATGKRNLVSREFLLADDENNSAEQLLYTLVIVPTRGVLRRNNQVVNVGDQFTQAELNSGRLEYEHTGNEPEEDSFVFTIIDGEGGWVDKTTFVINADEGFPSSVNEVLDANTVFEIFPNPASHIVQINPLESQSKSWNLEILSIDGQVLTQREIDQKTSLDVSGYNAGLYLLQFTNEGKTLSHKLTIVK